MRFRLNHIISLLIFTALILLIPLLANQTSGEVNWTMADFLVAAVILFGSGLLIQFLRRKIRNPAYQWLLILLVVGAVLLLWAELAVGVIRT